jgi:hypothetical protein
MFIRRMDISNNYINTINNISSTINAYNENMREYNGNIRRYLHIIEDMYNDRNVYVNPVGVTPLRNTTSNSSTPMLNTFLREYVRNRDEGNTFRNTYEDVVVRPTAAQIETATNVVIFDGSENNHNTSCPITLEVFRDGEELCSIRHCCHLFRRDALMDWFRQNVRCPVCRYDIREYAPPNTEDNEIDELLEESSEQPPPRRTNGFTALLANTIRSFVNQEMDNLPRHLNSAAELIYTFDIPISMDVSGNYRV